MALQAAVENAIQEHARNGVSIYVLRDGKIVELSAEGIKASSTTNL